MTTDQISAAEAEWREQFAAMKQALADLNLPEPEPDTTEDDGLDDSDFAGYRSGHGGQDVWDFISDDEDLDSSDFLDEVDGVDGDAEDHTAWFVARCSAIADKNGLEADDFQTQVSGLISSGLPEEELQSHLTDLIGFDDLDFIISILAEKDKIIASQSANHQPDLSGRRLLSKAQRAEALYRQDLDHKAAPLATSLTREAQYPHVYKSYSAGNTLSTSGQKYGLPVGSERKQFDKYEEYSIPAGRKGVLGPGQRLVTIKELDGLCRNTFKGYKALNRMQSLVYPVAYKTSENMLICAPTGAVRYPNPRSCLAIC